VTPFDYITGIPLITVVVLQMRARALTPERSPGVG